MQTISENTVRQYRLQATIGQRVHADMLTRAKTLVDKDPQAVKTYSGVLSGPTTAGAVYSISFVIDGRTHAIAYTTTGSEGSLGQIGVELAALINANPDVRGALEATATTTPTFVLTGLSTDLDFTATDASVSTAAIALTVTQAAAAAARIPFGRLILHAGFSNQATDPATELGKIADNNAFVAQTDELEIDFVSAAEYVIAVEVDGVKDAVSVTANTDSATTVGDIITALTALSSLAALGFAASDGGAGAGTTHTLDLTVPAGSDMTVEWSSATADTFGTFTTNKGTGTSFLIAAAGVSEWSYAEENAAVAGNEADYPPNAGMSVVSDGQIWVELDAGVTPVKGGSVWVDLTPGATAGRFYTVAGSGRRLLPGATWERGARTNSNDTLGALRIAL